MLLILPFATLGSLLPTWMFINALQLLAHLPLLNSNMPANAHYFLNKYLEKVRWYDKDFIKQIDESWNLKKYDVDVGAFHHLLKACGYEHIFLHNMFLIFAGMLLIAVFWLAFLVKDLIAKWSKSKKDFMKKKHSHWCQNFSLRFFYEFFLEFCIVVLINLSVADFSSFSPSFSYLISIALLVALLLVTSFVVYLLIRSGPYVPGYYQKHSAWSLFWGARPVDPSFDVKTYLRQNKQGPKKHRGWFRFIVENKPKEVSGE